MKNVRGTGKGSVQASTNQYRNLYPVWGQQEHTKDSVVESSIHAETYTLAKRSTGQEDEDISGRGDIESCGDAASQGSQEQIISELSEIVSPSGCDGHQFKPLLPL